MYFPDVKKHCYDRERQQCFYSRSRTNDLLHFFLSETHPILQNQFLSISGKHLFSEWTGRCSKKCAHAPPGFIPTSKSWSISGMVFIEKSLLRKTRKTKFRQIFIWEGPVTDTSTFCNNASAYRISKNFWKGTSNTREFLSIAYLRIVQTSSASSEVAWGSTARISFFFLTKSAHDSLEVWESFSLRLEANPEARVYFPRLFRNADSSFIAIRRHAVKKTTIIRLLASTRDFHIWYFCTSTCRFEHSTKSRRCKLSKLQQRRKEMLQTGEVARRSE